MNQATQSPSVPLTIRLAVASDAPTIAAFNSSMAWETEKLRLRPELVSKGVSHLIANPALGFYLVAETNGLLAGSLLVTTEWSDWRNGQFWWIQSVYVPPEHRRQGVYQSLYAQVKAIAEKDGNVCGYRLYVERDNNRAQQTYQKLGMHETHYRVFEEAPAGKNYFL